MGDVISGVGLGFFGRDHQALGPKCKSNLFCSSLFSGNWAKESFEPLIGFLRLFVEK